MSNGNRPGPGKPPPLPSRKTASPKRGDSPFDPPPSNSTLRGGLLSKSMPLKGLEDFCDRMGIGLRSGVDILRLLETESKRGNSTRRMAADDVKTRIRNGESLGEAMRAQGGYFPPLLVQMVDAGEAGGSLERVFIHMSEYYRDLRQSRGDFISRMTLPVIQLFAAICIISLVILLQGILHSDSGPNDLKFDASGIGLRGVNGVMIFLGIVGTFLAIALVTAFGIWKNWLGCHKTLVPLVRNVPVIGTVLTTLALSRLSMTLAMLLNAGVDAKKCVRESFKGTGNYYYMSGMEKAEEAVGKGDSFAEAFEASQVMPNEFIQAMEVGELSGTETNSLERLAHEYQQRAKRALTALAVTCSTVIWVGIALFLIFMIIRMFMSYINLLNNAGKM